MAGMVTTMKWIAAELHTHTCHSDGTFTTQGLCDAARAAGLSAIAITDHNTTAPLLELQPGRSDGAVAVIRGIEWTTFWGHLCILGGTLDVDWRDASPENMPLKLKDIRESGGICAIAHPFAVGSPMCTGCHWSFGITDFSDITCLEAWSEQFPCVRCECRQAVDFWVSLLDRGYRIAITYGRDWHGEDTDGLPRACTCLRVDGEITAENVLDAVARRRTAVTMGPLFRMETTGGAGSGDVVPSGRLALVFGIDWSFRREQWDQHNIQARRLQVLGEGGRLLWEADAGGDVTEIRKTLDVTGKYVRSQLVGTVRGQEAVIAMCTPIFLEAGGGT